MIFKKKKKGVKYARLFEKRRNEMKELSKAEDSIRESVREKRKTVLVQSFPEREREIDI